MGVFQGRKLSGSTDGKPIKIVATATAGTAVHTAVAGTTAGTWDEIWLWAQNNHTAEVTLTIEFGDANPESNIIITLASKSGLVPILPGHRLQNAATVKAFASVANVVSMVGHINTLTD